MHYSDCQDARLQHYGKPLVAPSATAALSRSTFSTNSNADASRSLPVEAASPVQL